MTVTSTSGAHPSRVTSRASTALAVEGLRVEVAPGFPIIEQIDLNLAGGMILGVVGESGSGKTTTARALLGYAPEGTRISGGEVSVGGQRVVGGDLGRSPRSVRGSLIAYVPQNPATALNPSTRVGDAVAYMLRVHDRPRGSDVVSAAFGAVGLPTEQSFLQRYPHQLSGGQRQRVCIAIALACDPQVVVLDEPTTGLDVVTQERILAELARLRDERGVSMVYVTHDLAAVARIADQIAVMYAGRIVEHGSAEQVLCRPRHPYTRGLIASTPDHRDDRSVVPLPGVAPGIGDRPSGCAFAPRCELRVEACDREVPPLLPVEDGEVRCIRHDEVPPIAWGNGRDTSVGTAGAEPLLQVSELRAEHTGRAGRLVVADDITFSLGRGQSVALVGESGSGKTTIARTVAGLHPVSSGEIRLDGEVLLGVARQRTREQRRRVQMIFQDPSDALNPRHTVEATIARSAQVLRRLSRVEASRETLELLDLVRLPARVAHRYPTELSGGERQRVAVARALVARPDVLICDEITSALDVSVQAAVLDLLRTLRADLGLAMLFITHDLGVVANIADEVLVLRNGKICEQGPAETVLRGPRDEYAKRLLAAAPSISSATTRPESPRPA